MATRLHVLLARKEPVAVIFRRGPTKQVLLVRWNLEDDTFEAGQWLKGRVYEERADLSPNGDLLVYFAGNQHPPFGTWTAVSRPPYFTAVALWPHGDTYGGGGLFQSQDALLLNNWAAYNPLADGFELPKGVEVGHLLRGDITAQRLVRDGWTFLVHQPEIWSRPCPRSARWELRMLTDGGHEDQGPHDPRRFELDDGHARTRADLGRADWADWAASGDLLLARNGRIHRASLASLEGADVWAVARELIDLSSLTFERREPPPEATRWRGSPPLGVPIGRR